jgi:DHA1 family bicyclomycin/chloramphenicol resistance-like MFS transporter
MVRFGFGGIAAPLVGIAGATSILPLGVVTVAAAVLAVVALLLTSPFRRRSLPDGSHPAASATLRH